jgi:hypothetical protein
VSSSRTSLEVRGGELTAVLGYKGTGVILKNVSLEVHGGELTTLFGSKRYWDLQIGSSSRTSPGRSMTESSKGAWTSTKVCQ